MRDQPAFDETEDCRPGTRCRDPLPWPTAHPAVEILPGRIATRRRHWVPGSSPGTTVLSITGAFRVLTAVENAIGASPTATRGPACSNMRLALSNTEDCRPGTRCRDPLPWPAIHSAVEILPVRIAARRRHWVPGSSPGTTIVSATTVLHVLTAVENAIGPSPAVTRGFPRPSPTSPCRGALSLPQR